MALILVIDDEAGVRQAVSRTLTRAGHTVTALQDARVGLAHLRERGVDLVITDVLMPEMDGIETIREIRLLLPAVGIIAMSGGGSRGNLILLEAASKLGADTILPKPFRAAELLAAVRGLLDGKKSGG